MCVGAGCSATHLFAQSLRRICATSAVGWRSCHSLTWEVSEVVPATSTITRGGLRDGDLDDDRGVGAVPFAPHFNSTEDIIIISGLA